MKNKIIIFFFAAFLSAAAVMFILPADKHSFEAENRTMSEMPAFTQDNIFSGRFAKETESHVNDSIAYRSYFLQLSRNFESMKGITPKTGSVISTNKDIGTGTTQKVTMLLVNFTIMEMFTRNQYTEKLYTDAVNHYARKLPQDIKLYSMIIPTQLEFQEPIYKNLQDSQTESINSMYSKMSDRVKTVDLCSVLGEHKNEYIYFRTDHHWTPLGAYYGYREFMKTEGGEAVNKDDFEKSGIRGVLGYLYDRVDYPELAGVPDTIEWYDVDKDKKIDIVMHNTDENGKIEDYSGVMFDRTRANYMFFFGSDHPIVEMTNNELQDGKTIVIIKDSYANVFTPWLIKSYHKVIMVDPRIYSEDFSLILDTYSPDEVLISNYIFTTNFPDYCQMLEKMYK